MTTHIQGTCVKPNNTHKAVARLKDSPDLRYLSDTTFAFRDEMEYCLKHNLPFNVYTINPLANGVDKATADAERDHANAVMKARGSEEFSNMETNYRNKLKAA
jgi:hypothetical protein